MVIPTLGTRPGWLRECISSVRSNPTSHPLDVCIVAPLSFDVAALGEHAEYVSVILSEKKGLSAAINIGWDYLIGADYFGWLGDDDLLAAGSLDRVAGVLDSDSRASAAYGNVRYIDELGRTIFVSRPGRLASAYLKYGKDLVPQPGSLFRAIGGAPPKVDESLSYGMDLDLFLSAKRSGRLRYVPHEVASFRLHGTSITFNNTDRSEADSIRSRYQSKVERSLVATVQPAVCILDRFLYRAIQRERHADRVPR